MSNNRETNQVKKKEKNFTALIIITILLCTGLGLTFYLMIRNANVEAARMFEKAKVKIDEFDELSNVYSKQEMENKSVEKEITESKKPWWKKRI